MSDYNYGLEPGIRGNGSSKVRFVLIFSVISAVTAFLLWFFWPGKETPSLKKTAAQNAEIKTENTGSLTGDRSVPEEKKEQLSPSAPAKNILPAPEEKKENKENITVSGKEQAPAQTVDPTDPPLPAKGIITPEDQKGADLPAVAVDDVISDARRAALKDAADALAEKKFEKSCQAAEKALEGVRADSAFYLECWRVLTAARVGIAFSGGKGEFVQRYRIKSGDSLSGIAGRFFTTVEFLRKRNNITGSRIFVGRFLYVVPGDWKITVSKKFRTLKLFRKDKEGEKLFAVWQVGIGRMNKTPSAEFAIASRVRHPDWYLPDGRVFKYGDAENQLGDYFLKLSPAAAPGRPLLGYGIHGAKDESAVGRSLSNGCIRMRNADVETLYYLVPAGTRVTITEE